MQNDSDEEGSDKDVKMKEAGNNHSGDSDDDDEDDEDSYDDEEEGEEEVSLMARNHILTPWLNGPKFVVFRMTALLLMKMKCRRS